MNTVTTIVLCVVSFLIVFSLPTLILIEDGRRLIGEHVTYAWIVYAVCAVCYLIAFRWLKASRLALALFCIFWAAYAYLIPRLGFSFFEICGDNCVDASSEDTLMYLFILAMATLVMMLVGFLLGRLSHARESRASPSKE